MCFVFWLFLLSCQYLPSDWLERPLCRSLIVARGSSPESPGWRVLINSLVYCIDSLFLPCDAMCKCGLCCRPVSIRPSRWCIASRRLKIRLIVKRLSQPSSPMNLVFDPEHRYWIPWGTLQWGRKIHRRWENFVILTEITMLSRKWYGIGWWLLWNVRCTLSNGDIFNDLDWPNLVFKVMAYFKDEYLKNGASYGQSYYREH